MKTVISCSTRMIFWIFDHDFEADGTRKRGNHVQPDDLDPDLNKIERIVHASMMPQPTRHFEQDDFYDLHGIFGRVT